MRPGIATRVRSTAALVSFLVVVAGACAVSPRQEIELGRQYAAEISQQLPIVNDPEIDRYINALGTRIAQHTTRRDFTYRFYVVNTDAVNAFAIPGGFVYVNRGLIERTENLSELAAVLAHEIAHVDERHGAEQIERVQRANIGLTLAYILIGRAPGGLERAAIQLGGAAVFASYSRAAEREADALAVPMLVAAGIDPRGLPSFFRTLLEERSRRPGAVEQWFSTHPLEEDRIAQAEAQIAQYPPDWLRNLTTNTAEFEAFQARVRALPPPPPEFRMQG
ncbi:MAG TPA: M48 family metallopeptidase [Longimicrobiales bacterium]|nr:M48 family metallopeptidase [Longimicrobiales bacterium]